MSDASSLGSSETISGVLLPSIPRVSLSEKDSQIILAAWFDIIERFYGAHVTLIEITIGSKLIALSRQSLSANGS